MEARRSGTLSARHSWSDLLRPLANSFSPTMSPHRVAGASMSCHKIFSFLSILPVILMSLDILPVPRPGSGDRSLELNAAYGQDTRTKVTKKPTFMMSTDNAIKFFEKRVGADPQDFMSYTILGQLHIRKARETGNVECYTAAEVACRRALE